MQQAIDYEIRWQIEQIEDGRAIEQATVLFNPDTGETRAMRTKEDAADYRYFPDPDLPPLVIQEQWIEDVRAQMGELPRAMAARFVADYGVPEYDAATLTQSKAMAAYFEAVAQASGQAKLASNWIMGEVSKWLNAVEDYSFERFTEFVPALNLAALITRISDNTISNSAGKTVFVELTHAPGTMYETALAYVDSIIDAKGLRQMNDTGALEALVDQVIAANADNVAQYRAGKDKAFNALVGQVMKASKGKANPQQATDLLRARLSC
jgi:aspartyl-tRNA(Asn)/glutamyl-tRNA(Gln) amidotransferase subunit B